METLLCVTCGSPARRIQHELADGECPNCGLVALDVDFKDGKPFECYSLENFLARKAELAERAANPPAYDPDDVPF
ncbi:MAG: hypothetical protein ABSH09_27590 [Bryobacteraceae bacterium]|jgi:predicted RNA-binding Zn-ribbon protein involved in translation (DUF1610 family)